MYRFIAKKKLINQIDGFKISIAVFVLIAVLFFVAVSKFSKDSLDRQEEALKAAVNRGIVSCYCIEGAYPATVEYLEKHYGLYYDKETFFVDIKPIGSNIYPDVTIVRRGH